MSCTPSSSREPSATTTPVSSSSDFDGNGSLSGDSSSGKPGMLDLKGKAKWQSWNDKKGMSTDEAKEKYVAFAEQLMAKYA